MSTKNLFMNDIILMFKVMAKHRAVGLLFKLFAILFCKSSLFLIFCMQHLLAAQHSSVYNSSSAESSTNTNMENSTITAIVVHETTKGNKQAKLLLGHSQQRGKSIPLPCPKPMEMPFGRNQPLLVIQPLDYNRTEFIGKFAHQQPNSVIHFPMCFFGTLMTLKMHKCEPPLGFECDYGYASFDDLNATGMHKIPSYEGTSEVVHHRTHNIIKGSVIGDFEEDGCFLGAIHSQQPLPVGVYEIRRATAHFFDNIVTQCQQQQDCLASPPTFHSFIVDRHALMEAQKSTLD